MYANYRDERREIMRAVGEKCAEWRKTQGLSQADIADVILSPQSVSKFERGENDSLVVYQMYRAKGMGDV